MGQGKSQNVTIGYDVAKRSYDTTVVVAKSELQEPKFFEVNYAELEMRMLMQMMERLQGSVYSELGIPSELLIVSNTLREIKRCYLRFDEGTSNKHYFVSLYEISGSPGGKSWQVRVAWGKCSPRHKPREDIKETSSSKRHAQSVFDDVVKEKMKKGYYQCDFDDTVARAPDWFRNGSFSVEKSKKPKLVRENAPWSF